VAEADFLAPSPPPDYAVLREQAGFGWSMRGTYLACLELAGVPIRDFYLQPEACIEAYRVGRPRLRELLGEDVHLPGVATPPISYGHANGLGAELQFPEGGEVAHTHPFDSLDAGIEALRRPVDFASAGMAPYYLDFRKQMQAAFPDERVGFGYGLEGPLTTAYELRGDGFFVDLLDRPDDAKEFLRLATASIGAFHRFRCEVAGVEPVSQDGAGMCDDIASFVPPRLWPEMVLPVWQQYYRAKTTGRRSAHVENLTGDQLPFLEAIGLVHYDPSISPALNPPIVARRCRVPFLWRLPDMYLPILSEQDVRDFVFQSAADGASGVFVTVLEGVTRPGCVQKLRAFAEAGRQAQALLAAGSPRAELAGRVSDAGRAKFWDHWPE